jgi:hypothetical protein
MHPAQTQGRPPPHLYSIECLVSSTMENYIAQMKNESTAEKDTLLRTIDVA